MGLGDRFKRIFGQGKKDDEEIVNENGIVEFESSANESFRKDLEDVGENEPDEIELSPNLNVLFVCSANTDRSPIAEAIFNKKATGQKAFSAGLNAQNGNSASDNAIMVCAKYGIDISGHRTRSITNFPVNKMGLVLAATANVRDAMKILYPNIGVFTIKEYAGGYSDSDISDPFGGDLSVYDECFREIDEAVSRILGVDAEVIDRPAEADDGIIDKPGQIRNFGYLDDLIHSGIREIALDSDIVFDDEFGYRKGIRLDVDGLIINGNGHAIDGDGKARIFSCAGDNITIKNVILKNAYCEDSGGAIFNEGKLNIHDSDLTDNETLVCGGAIDNDGTLKIENCNFHSNSSQSGGGAIYNYGDLEIVNSSLSDNASTDSCYEIFGSGGGAIYNGGSLTISGSSLSNNTTKSMWGGGAIYNCGNLSVVKTQFLNNRTEIFRYVFGACIDMSAQYCGGAVYNRGRMHIGESQLSKNKSTAGGAIYSSGDLKISGSVLSDNVAINGGAIGCFEDSGFLTDKNSNIVRYESIDDLAIEDSEFNNNEARIGGAVFGNDIHISNSIFYRNSAVELGGSMRNSELEVSEVDHDPVVTNGFGIGGAISGSNLDISDSQFSNNVAKSGGAIRGAKLIISNSKLQNNGADEGGAIAHELNFDDEWSIISDSVLCDNGADHGGAIYNNFNLKIMNSGFKDNRASLGKSIFNHSYKGEPADILRISNCEFNGHVVDSADGEVIDNVECEIFDDSIHSDDCEKENFNIGHFKKRVSYVSSGGESEEQVKNFRYLDYLIHSGTKEIVLDSDIVFDEGEGFRLHSPAIELDIDGMVIDGNGHYVDAKGMVSVFKCVGKNITIKNITLKNGHCSGDGGAISVYEGGLTVINSVLCDNSADSDGGAISNFSGSLTVIESTLKSNCAHKEGGAIDTGWGSLTVKGSVLCNNSSGEKGGAIYNNIRNETSIEGSTFDKNSSIDGGAIYCADGDLIMSRSTLTGNSADEHAGTINHYEGILKIFNCEISNSRSPNGIVHNNDYMQVFNTDFTNNKSEHVLVNGSEKSIAGIFNGKFEDNDVAGSVIFNGGKFCTVERSIFNNNLSNDDADNIINRGELTLISPKIEDGGKTVLNDEYIFIKDPSEDLMGKIYGEGIVETNLIPDEILPDFEYLDEKIHIGEDYEDEFIKISFNEDNKVIKLKSDFRLELYERDFCEGGVELDIDGLVVDGDGKTIDGANRSRIFFVTGDNITLKNIKFKGGHAYENYENPLNLDGGALKVINNDLTLTVENCEFDDCMSEGNGGAIYQKTGYMNIINSTLSNSVAENSGGAICNDEGMLAIAESTFENNFADYGGAIRNIHGTLNMSKSSILTANRAKSSGGAISDGGISDIEETTISQNTAQRGGAISNGGKMTIRKSVLRQNRAEEYYGGAIDNGDELTIIDSEIRGNFAERDGGAIHNNCADLTLIGSSFSGNRANERGDAIFNYRENSFKVESCDLDFWDIVKYNEYDGD